mgnify:CR=1
MNIQGGQTTIKEKILYKFDDYVHHALLTQNEYVIGWRRLTYSRSNQIR